MVVLTRWSTIADRLAVWDPSTVLWPVSSPSPRKKRMLVKNALAGAGHVAVCPSAAIVQVEADDCGNGCVIVAPLSVRTSVSPAREMFTLLVSPAWPE